MLTEQGEIVLKCHLTTEDDDVLFDCEITDTGIGIPEERLDQLFNSFTQADASTTRRYGGTGLGLAITKKLCELMGGKLTATSEIGQGSKFKFTVRLKSSSKQIDNSIHNSTIDFARLKILVIDTNKTSRELIKTQLQTWKANVFEASNDMTALQLCYDNIENQSESPPFDLILMDASQADINVQLLNKCFQSNHVLQRMTLVIIIPITQQGRMQEFTDSGFNRCLLKPIIREDLLNLLEVTFNDKITIENQYLPLEAQINLPETQKDSSYNQVQELDEKDKLASVLLVEDNRVNQVVIKTIFKKRGLKIDVAKNGQEALSLLKKVPEQNPPYNLILMDCQMPIMDGYQATEQIRLGYVGSQYQNVPIIALTANAMKGD